MNPSELSILIILMGSLGDVVRGMAIIKPLKQNYPKCKITWLVEEKCSGILELNKDIDEIIVFNRKTPLPGVLKLRSDLKARHFDITLDLQRHFKSGIFSWFSNSKRRIGFHRLDSKEFNWIFNNEKIPLFGDKLPKIEHYLKFLDYLKVKYDHPLDFGFTRESVNGFIPEILKSVNRYAVFVLGSTWETKDWPEEGYRSLGQEIVKELGLAVVLLGDQKKKEMAKSLMAHLPNDKVIDLTANTTIRELVGIIAGAAVSIGPDSGPGHIAGAVGTPYVAVFGPTDPIRTAPYNGEALVVRSHVPCSPCYRKVCPGLNKICMRLITARNVLEKVKLATS